MAHFPAGFLLRLSFIAATSRAATIAPRFTWDTMQPFLHFANTSGPFADGAIGIMAKFPMVTIEKFQ
tara:strand:- start:240 stop:440 length:201 start_codon:yes stop_codon:yes gene_type:complete